MCGIAGIYDRLERNDPQRDSLVRQMTRTLVHRGPDDEGYLAHGPVGLGHRRLSIIDLATGHQPLSNEDGSVWIVFNGEIYNYRDLTRVLESKGHVFKTQSDTETIVHAYEEWGVDCLERLRGMFAFAAWDQRRRRLFLARDRLGKKPLYYGIVDGKLIFGSEIKALLAFPGFDRTLDIQALSDYFSLLYIPSPKTIFRQVRKLPPGHYLLAAREGVSVRRYWDVHFAPSGPAPDQTAHRLLELLDESVRIRLRSDVPLGAFLSGGLDSSAVVGIMSRLIEGPVISASIGFPDGAFDELQYARQVAEHFRTNHHEHMVTPDAMQVLDDLVWHYDEPFADASAAPTYYVSKLAREHVTVALSGDGGDESFGGYRRYVFDTYENEIRHLIPAVLRIPIFGLLGRVYPKADYLPRFLRGKAFLANLARTPWEAYFRSVSGIDEADKRGILSGDLRRALGDYGTSSLFEALYGRAPASDPLSRIQYIDFNTYLPDGILTKVDRASMANSLEVRCPLLDHQLVEYAASLPPSLKLKGMQTKLVFREAVRGQLPERIFRRPKMGFVPPVGRWLGEELYPLVEDHLLGGGTSDDLIDPHAARSFWREHRSGTRDRSRELWAILIFKLWHERFVKRGTYHESAPAPGVGGVPPYTVELGAVAPPR